MDYQVAEEDIWAYQEYLVSEEHGKGAVERYLRDIRSFFVWASGRMVGKRLAAAWKEHLVMEGYSTSTVNSMLSALNSFLEFMGWTQCRVKLLRIQRTPFRKQERDLQQKEYERLKRAAGRKGKERLTLLMETICGTGIRVSEVRYITVEAARGRKAEIFLKGKVRVILLPDKLCQKLLRYAKRLGISEGEIFVTRSGKGLSRQYIWQEMKKLCKDAHVEASKVYPHNLRHLFAKLFYRVSRDIVKLADVLGHSSVETTRIYLMDTGAEHARWLEQMGVV